MEREAGFVIVVDTTVDGVVPAEWDDQNRPVFYPTYDEAKRELDDAAAMRLEAVEDGLMEDAGDDEWVEVAERYPDGSIHLPEQQRLFTLDDLRRVRGM